LETSALLGAFYLAEGLPGAAVGGVVFDVYLLTPDVLLHDPVFGPALRWWAWSRIWRLSESDGRAGTGVARDLGEGMSFSTHGSTPGSERTSGLGGGLHLRFRGCRLYRPVKEGGDGHHDGEPEREDHRARPDLEERISLEPVG
jgi:hypothetical protein